MADINAINRAIAPKRADLIDEVLHVLGGGYMAADVSIPHPVAGVVTLMEIARLPWIDGRSPEPADILAAVVLLEMRDDAVGLVMQAITTDNPAEHLAEFCVHEFNDRETELVGSSISRSMNLAAVGFNFFPKDRNDKPEIAFGSEFIAGICRVYGELGVPPDVAIWEEPLARVGFIMAAVAKAGGVKNIGRENTLDWDQAWRAIKNGD